MKQKVELVKIRKLGEIVDDSIDFFKQNWKPLLKSYFTICGVFWVSGIIIAAFNQTQTFKLQQEGESIFSLTFFLALLFGFINFTFTLLTTLSFMVLYREKGNEAPGVDEVWAYVKYYIPRFFGSAVLLAILTAVGAVLCVLPGIYLMVVFLVVGTIMIFENASFNYSFNRGFQLIKNNWWNSLGVFLVLGIIVAAGMVLFIIPVAMIVSIILYLTNFDRGFTISMAVTLALHGLEFFYLLPFISLGLIYHNLNEQKDDQSLLARIENLGKNIQETNNLPAEEY